MNIAIWIMIALLFIGIVLFLRKRLIVYSIKPWSRISFYTIGFKRHWIPQIVRMGITKVSARKFKGCKSAKRVYKGWYKSPYKIGDTDIIKQLCNKDLRQIFWHIPKTIYYA